MALINSRRYVLILLTYLHLAGKNTCGETINKSLVKAHRKRTRLRNKFLKNRTETKRVCYKKQQNFCVNLLRKTKKDFYRNLNEKGRIDDKRFWKTVKPRFSDK